MSTSYDPYAACQDGCNHDLAPGVLVSELLSGDGPRASLELVFGLPRARRVVEPRAANPAETAA